MIRADSTSLLEPAAETTMDLPRENTVDLMPTSTEACRQFESSNRGMVKAGLHKETRNAACPLHGSSSGSLLSSRAAAPASRSTASRQRAGSQGSSIARRGPTRRARTARWRASTGAFSARCSAPRGTALRLWRCGSRPSLGPTPPGASASSASAHPRWSCGAPCRGAHTRQPRSRTAPRPSALPSRSSLTPSTSRNHTEAVGYALIAVRHPPG